MAMSDPDPGKAFLDVLFATGEMGLCVFDEAGFVCSIEGAASDWAPAVGHRIDESPVFVGMFDAIRALREGAAPLSIAGVAIPDAGDEAFDVNVHWVGSINRYVASSRSATERLREQRAATQGVRDNRLLQEMVREQQARIAEQAEMMAIFVRHVPAAVAMLDESLDVLMTSERWKQDHGDPALAPPGVETASPLTWPDARSNLRLALDGGVPSSRVEKAEIRGRTIWKRLAQAPWRRADRQIGGAILFSEDVTEAMRKAENLRARVDDLRKLGEEMDRLGHAVTNDLRAPMRQMDFFSRFLLDNEAQGLDGASRDYLRQIRACAERIDEMMSALQRYLRLTERDLVESPVSIGDATKAATTVLHDALIESAIVVSLRDSLTIEADFALISGLLEKLVDNSIKYAGPGSLVVIECFEEPDGVLLRVTDDGPGIPAHLRRRAFDFFERLDAPAAIRGTGMGLAECRKIADLHGGAMTLDPDFDAGLRVLVSLPRRARRPEGARPARLLV